MAKEQCKANKCLDECCVTDPDPRVGLLQAQTCNMRSKCRCSCVLQFTLCHAFSSVLHRPPSQLIHCIALCLGFSRLAARNGCKKKISSCLILSPGRGSKEARNPACWRELLLPSTAPAGSRAAVRHNPTAKPATGGRTACTTRGRQAPGPRLVAQGNDPEFVLNVRRTPKPLMILPQVHLRKPCYDFYFL